MAAIQKVLVFIACLVIINIITVGSSRPPEDSTHEFARTIQLFEFNPIEHVVELGVADCSSLLVPVLGKELGFFYELSIDVNLNLDGQLSESLLSGELDALYLDATALQSVSKQSSRLASVAHNHWGSFYYLIGSNKIQNAGDLVRRNVALSTYSHEINPLWTILADLAGIPADVNNYEIMNMTQRDAYMAMKAGELEGALLCEPWSSMTEYDGTGQVLIDYVSLSDGNMISCAMLLMNRDFIEEQPELAAKIVLAHVNTIKSIYYNPLESGRLFADYFDIPQEVGLMTVYKKTVQEGRTLNWELDEERLDDFKNLAEELGCLDLKDITAADLMDHSLIRQWEEIYAFEEFMEMYVDPVFPLNMSYEEWKRAAVLRAAGEI